jgi:hypothetical protein
MPSILVKRGTEAALLATNPVVASGELIYSTDTAKLKIGDGVSSYSGLPIVGSGIYSLTTHTHTSSDITNFNSSVSGLLPLSIQGYEILSSSKSLFTVDGGYLSGNLNVFLNGSKLLINDDYTANNGTSFVLTQTAVSGDMVEWQGISTSATYATISHTHTTSQITDFNSSVSGLLPVKNVVAGTNIGVTSISGTYTINNSKTIQKFTPRDNHPPSSNYATLDTRNSILVLEFDAATEESSYFVGIVDEAATLTNGLVVRIWWMADTATSGNVRWGVQFEKYGTDLDADSFDTNAQVTSAANGTSGIESVAEITITTIDSLAAGDRFRLRVYRVAADATNDTMSGDAQLTAIEVRAA